MNSGPKRVLVVDDEPAMREVLMLGLRSSGFDAVQAGSAEEALALLREHEEIAVVITDIRMPGTNGLDLLVRAVAERPEATAFASVVISADTQLPHVTGALRVGAVDFLAKPLTLGEVLQATQRAMAQATKRRAAAAELQGLRGRQAALEAEVRTLAERRTSWSAPPSQEDAKEWLQRARLLEHELRTPLVPVLGYAELLRAGDAVADEARQFGEEITRGAERLLATINRLLKYHSLMEPAPVVRLQPCQLQAAVVKVWRALGEVASTRQVGLSAEIPGTLTVTADPELLELLLWELLNNAAAHSPAGGTVAVRATVVEGAVEMAIADNGPGWPAGVAERLGEAFLIGGNVMTRNRGGLGLGLATVQQIAQLHHGTFAVLPNPAGGGVALMRFPQP